MDVSVVVLIFGVAVAQFVADAVTSVVQSVHKMTLAEKRQRARDNALVHTFQEQFQFAHRNRPPRLAHSFAKALEKGLIDFADRFSVIRDEPEGKLDRSAKSVITEYLGAYGAFVSDGDPIKLIPDILTKTVCSESNRPGALHITSIPGAMSTARSRLFICGLSSDLFPGDPKEDHLLLDNDLTAVSSEAAELTSAGRIERRKRELDDLISLSDALGTDIHLSFSDYGLADLKDRNPSSALFSYYERSHPGASTDDFMASLRKAGFFDAALSASREDGRAYSLGSELSSSACGPAAPDTALLLENAWSPSAIEIFFQCPCRFYLSRILRLPEPEEDDPFTVIPPNDLGTLAHSLMEKLADRSLSRDDFMILADTAFEEYLITRPPLHAGDAGRVKAEFTDMMLKAYEQDMAEQREVISSETEYTFEHPSGVKLHGYPDRVEKTGGRFLIADFKTKRKIEHIEDDIDSCLQAVIYAWLLEQAGLDISGCEYRYLRKGRSVSCRYDQEMKDRLAAKMEFFRDALKAGSFPRDPGKNDEHCRYCGFAEICRSLTGEEAEEEADDEQ